MFVSVSFGVIVSVSFGIFLDINNEFMYIVVEKVRKYNKCANVHFQRGGRPLSWGDTNLAHSI